MIKEYHINHRSYIRWWVGEVRGVGPHKQTPVLPVGRAAATGTGVSWSSQWKLLFLGASWLLSSFPAPGGGIRSPREGVLLEGPGSTRVCSLLPSSWSLWNVCPQGSVCSREFLLTQRVPCYSRQGKIFSLIFWKECVSSARLIVLHVSDCCIHLCTPSVWHKA